MGGGCWGFIFFFFQKGWVWKWNKRSLGVISLDCDPDAQTLRLGQADEDDEPEEEDPFSAKLMTFDVSVGADKRLLQICIGYFQKLWSFIFLFQKKKKIKNISIVYFSLCDRKIMDLMFGVYVFVLQQEDTEFRPVVVTRSVLQTLSRSEVYILKRPKPLRYQFFRSLLPDVTITQCPKCNKVMS